MISISINNTIYRIPQTWDEVPFNRVEAIMHSDDLLLALTGGVPIEVLQVLPDHITMQVTQAIEALSIVPPVADVDLEVIDINAKPFSFYAAAYLAKDDKLAFTRVFYPDAEDNIRSAMPRFMRALESWQAFHNYWSWIDKAKDPLWSAAGGSRLDKYGPYGIIAPLSNRSYKELLALYDAPTKDVFTMRAFFQEFDEISLDYSNLLRQKNTPKANGQGAI